MVLPSSLKTIQNIIQKPTLQNIRELQRISTTQKTSSVRPPRTSPKPTQVEPEQAGIPKIAEPQIIAGTVLVPPKKPIIMQPETRKQIISEIRSGKHPAIIIKKTMDLIKRQEPFRPPATRRIKSPVRTTSFIEQNINQFNFENPGFVVPVGKYGPYDMVKIKNKSITGFKQDPTGRLLGLPGPGERVEYEFYYSPVAEHKIKIAGNTDYYDQYLNIVRTHPELPALHLFKSYLNIDLALASNKPGIAGASEREEILIKHLHEWKGSPESKGDILRGAGAVLENPFVLLSLTRAGGQVGGKVLGAIGGKVAAKWGPTGVLWFQRAQVIGGAGLASLPAYDIYKTAKRGETGEAVGKATMLGLNLAAGLQGFREGRADRILFGKGKGLTHYEKNLLKAISKPGYKGYFNEKQVNMLKVELSIQQDMFNKNLQTKIAQNVIKGTIKEPTLRNVENLKKAEYRDNFIRAVKNYLKTTRSEGYGGAFVEKTSTHDIDLAFKSAKNPVEMEYIARKLGLKPEQIIDIHQMLSIGAQTEFAGATKLPSVRYPSGLKGINEVDQFMRVAQGSVMLEHEGRVKDLAESIRMMKLIYNNAYPNGIPKDSLAKMAAFEKVYLDAMKNPADLILPTSQANILYSPGKIWETKQKIYKKILPEKYLQKQFYKKTGLPELPSSLDGKYTWKKPYDPIARLIRSLPSVEKISPTISPALRPSPAISTFSAAFWNWFKGLPSSSKKAVSSQMGINLSKLYKDISSKSKSIVSGYPSSIYGYPGYPSRPSRKYVSRPPSKPPSTPPSKPPSTPPSTPPYSPYYPYYPSYPSYPSSSPPSSPFVPQYPPEIFWGPGIGGKFARRGKIDPFWKKYYDELEATQRLVGEVIL